LDIHFVAANLQAAKANWLLAVPALLYAVNNYLKFSMQVFELVSGLLAFSITLM
jgi:hypothetical protein